MPDHDQIYQQQASQYDLLVTREDYQHNIVRTLNQIIPFDNLIVVELGAGTGRLTCMLAPMVKHIYAFDGSEHMLNVAASKLQHNQRSNWQLAVGDNRTIALEDGIADLAISGWSICYLVVDHPQGWQAELDKSLAEMRRVIKPDGMIILVETLGTGYEQPTPPAHLVDYYAYLEAKGFQRIWIRTDYKFQDQAEAEELARFFFGEEMLGKLSADEGGITLPECTGIWYLHTR